MNIATKIWIYPFTLCNKLSWIIELCNQTDRWIFHFPILEGTIITLCWQHLLQYLRSLITAPTATNLNTNKNIHTALLQLQQLFLCLMVVFVTRKKKGSQFNLQFTNITISFFLQQMCSAAWQIHVDKNLFA